MPTIDFLSSQLINEEDVELFIGFQSPRSAHYVTLTGIRWNTVLEDGEITFVDPANGQTRTAGIFGQGARPGIGVRYTTIDGEERVGLIRAAVAESAIVPEPSPLHLFGLAIIAVAIVRHRQIRQQAK